MQNYFAMHEVLAETLAEHSSTEMKKQLLV